MAIGNVELMHELSPKHLHRVTSRMTKDIEIEGEGEIREYREKHSW